MVSSSLGVAARRRAAAGDAARAVLPRVPARPHGERRFPGAIRPAPCAALGVRPSTGARPVAVADPPSPSAPRKAPERPAVLMVRRGRAGSSGRTCVPRDRPGGTLRSGTLKRGSWSGGHAPAMAGSTPSGMPGGIRSTRPAMATPGSVSPGVRAVSGTRGVRRLRALRPSRTNSLPRVASSTTRRSILLPPPDPGMDARAIALPARLRARRNRPGGVHRA